MIEVYDDIGRRIALAAPARRVVSLVPSLTETIFALGAGTALVGATRYCTEPASALVGIARVSGTKNPDLTRLRALQPDLVLLNAEENRKADFEALEQARLPIFVSFTRRLADVPELLRRLGTLTGTQATADAIAESLQQAIAAPHDRSQRPRVFCPIWKNPWMSFNRDTYTGDMLRLAGADNVCRDYPERYCSVTLEEIAATQPEVILLPNEPYVFQAKDLPALAALHDTPAYQAQRIHFIDGKALSWYGPRTAPALNYFKALMAR